MGNRATISHQNVVLDNDRKHANDLVKKAGKIVTPRGCEYLGSAVVHYFRQPSKDSPLAIEQNHEYAVVTQVLVKKVSEGFADIGWKQLKTDLMKAFGRTPPRTRSPGGIIIP